MITLRRLDVAARRIVAAGTSAVFCISMRLSVALLQ
jgi:hypothetical protein